MGIRYVFIKISHTIIIPQFFFPIYHELKRPGKTTPRKSLQEELFNTLELPYNTLDDLLE